MYRPRMVVSTIKEMIFGLLTRTRYSAVFGPKLGTRSMVTARFSWGYAIFHITIERCLIKHLWIRYYGAIIPSALTVFSMQGFLILNCIVGGQMLASVSNGHLDDTLGIVIISIISFAVGLFV